MSTPLQSAEKLSTIIDNQSQNTVLEALKRILPEAQSLDVATGYFEIGSLLALDSFWNQLKKIRLIMGDEMTKRTRRELVNSLRKASAESIEHEKEKDDSLTGLTAIRQALEEKRILARVYTRAKFHAKTMLLEMLPPHLSNYGIVGSSNFTEPGLRQNVELNLLTTDQLQLQALQSWFDVRWEEGENIKDELLQVIAPHLREYAPFEIYCKALDEYFRMTGTDQPKDEWEKNHSKIFPLLSAYQIEGYNEALNMARRWHGALICDGVGLGKTFIGLMLIERLLREGKRILLVVPKSTRDSVWERKLERYLEINANHTAYGTQLEIHSHTDFGREGKLPQKKKVNRVAKHLKDFSSGAITGPIQWDQVSEYFTGDKLKEAIRLLWAENIQRFALVPTRKRTGKEWFRVPRNFQRNPNIVKKSIITQRTTADEQPFRIIATLVSPHDLGSVAFSENGTNYIEFDNESGNLPEFILGMLNSKLYDFLFRQLSSNTHVSSGELNSLPFMIDCKAQTQDLISSLVRKILENKKVNPEADTSLLERKIDMLIYELYELTEAEIRIIESEIQQTMLALSPALHRPRANAGEIKRRATKAA